jgi:hypothetical protein
MTEEYNEDNHPDLSQLVQHRTDEFAAEIAYLASTDWMATREAETGTAMPADVKAKRAEARTAIV